MKERRSLYHGSLCVLQVTESFRRYFHPNKVGVIQKNIKQLLTKLARTFDCVVTFQVGVGQALA